MEKFNGKYRIQSARHQGWNYGAYFITICTQNKDHFFGECTDGKMKLSTIGAIVQGFWYEIPKHFSFIQLGEFVVMPNHVHGVLILDKNDNNFIDVAVETLQCSVSTRDDKTKNEFYQKISPKQGSVSTIIRSYKSICSKHIHATFPDLNFEWQTRFWDNIIKDDEAFQTISNYILNNPKNWENDKFFGNENPS